MCILSLYVNLGWPIAIWQLLVSYVSEYSKGLQLKQPAVSSSPKEVMGWCYQCYYNPKRALAPCSVPACARFWVYFFTLYEEWFHSDHILSFAGLIMSVSLPCEKIFFYIRALHMPLFQVSGTPHSGSHSDSCAISSKMIRTLITF